MEIKIEGNVIRHTTNGFEIDFTIKAGDRTYIVSNCHRGNTEQNVFEEGTECYSGNIDIENDGVIKTISATLWVKPNNKCECIYQQV